MKRSSLISIACLAIVFIFHVTTFENFVNAYPDGISGYTGSPSTGGNNCSSCHFVASTSRNEFITLTNDIPTTGYVPNVTYNFTLSILSKRTRAGFNIRLEDTKGEVAGTLNNVDSLARTEQGELTHTIKTLIDKGKGQYAFTWNAPSTGDTVKLFAVAATSPRNGTLDTLNTFEQVFRSALPTSLSDKILLPEHFAVSYGQESLHITYMLTRTSQVQIKLYGTTGNWVKTIYEGTRTQGEQDHMLITSSLKNGIYLARIVINGKVTVKKIAIGS